MKDYIVDISESYKRTVIVAAEDEREASEIAETLCQSGQIAPSDNGTFTRSCRVCFGALPIDEGLFDHYSASDVPMSKCCG